MPNNIVPVDGLKFTINEHIQDDEKYVDYDPNEDFNEIDNDDDDDYAEDANDNDWTVSVYKSETKSPKRRSNSRNLVTKKLKRTGAKSRSIDKTLPGDDTKKFIKPSNKTKCQAIIEPIADENDMLYRKRTKSKFSNKTKCHAIIEPITDEEEIVARKRSKSKFSGFVAALHIHIFEMRNIQ